MLKEGTYKNIHLKIVADKEAAARHFAHAMAEMILQNNGLHRPTRLIIPVGPTAQYPMFAERCNRERIDLSHTDFYAMDEYVGDDGVNLPEDHPLAFSRFLRNHLLDRIDPGCRFNARQLHVPDARDARGYADALEAAGGIDACFGGIGINGHIAFNEALDYWELMDNEAFKNLPTRVVKIAATTKVINAVFGTGGNLQAVPNLAVTVGMKEILASRRVRIYLDWPWQRQALRNVLFGPVTPMFPASFLQEHPDVTITATEEIAEKPKLEPE